LSYSRKHSQYITFACSASRANWNFSVFKEKQAGNFAASGKIGRNFARAGRMGVRDLADELFQQGNTVTWRTFRLPHKERRLKRSAIWGGMALGLALMTAPNAAQAQADEVPELAKDWSVRVGLYVFQSETARDAQGAVGISGMAERTVYYGNGYDVNVGVGYNGFDRVYNVPITINIIGRQGRYRYGVGGGYAFGKRVDGRGMQGSVIDLILGYQLTLGKNPLSADLRYLFISGSNNELDGFSLTLGMRF
jgi:hypothetical protein